MRGDPEKDHSEGPEWTTAHINIQVCSVAVMSVLVFFLSKKTQHSINSSCLFVDCVNKGGDLIVPGLANKLENNLLSFHVFKNTLKVENKTEKG